MTSFVPPRASAAIRIVAPSASPSSPAPSVPSTPSREQPPKLSPKKATPKCRNILIHGHCKNEGKGCIYDHSDGPSQTSNPPVPAASSVVSSTATAVNVNAPVFVPKTPHIASPVVAQATPAANLNLPIDEDGRQQADPQQTYFDQAADYNLAAAMNSLELDSTQSSSYLTDEAQARLYAQAGYLDTQEYYHAPLTFVHQPLNYHLYTQLPYLPYGSTSQSKPLSHRFFMSDTLREDLQRRSEAIYSLTPRYPSNNEKALPDELHVYHSLIPLEPSGSGSGTSSPGGGAFSASASAFYPHPSSGGGGDSHKDVRDSREQPRRKWFAGCSSMVYKATNREDGSLVALRRIEGFRLMQESAFGAVEAWGKIKHPNIVSLREAFTTRAFGDHSLVFAYDYHPTAQTLYNLHFGSDAQHSASSRTPRNYRYGKGGHTQRDSGSNGLAQNHVEESIMWSYVIQIANAMKEVHDQGLAFRTLDVSKVLVTGKNRVRVNCCGIFDVITYDPRPTSVEALQQEDLLAFGKLIFALCCHNVSAVNNLPKAIEVLSRHYSSDMKNVALFLISKPGPGKVIDQLLEMFGTRLLTEMNAIQNYADHLEGELMSELENARLVRLMSKMGFINERPDFNHELRWSETGDRYIISLFRDYVFHQVDEMQKPVVNLTHIITCLNKLDAGTDERIMLVSRDEQTCLVVSYKEIKACIDSAFSELARPRLPGILR